MSSVSINGVNYSGRNITISGNKVYIDGVDNTPESKNISIVVNGDLESLKADNCNTIEVTGSVMALNTISGDVKVGGNVDGSVKTMSGDVLCGSVGGNISTMSGDVKYRKNE